MSASKRFVNRVWQGFLDNKGHDYNCFRGLKIIDAKPGFVTATLLIEDYQINRFKTLHGGLTSSLIDTMGSLSLSSKGYYLTGVSTDLHVTFVRAAKPGDTILLESELISMGRTLAFTRVMIKDSISQKVLAFGSHTKYIVPALTCSDNIKLSEDGETELL